MTETSPNSDDLAALVEGSDLRGGESHTITVEGLEKHFGDYHALRDVTLTIPNGAYVCEVEPVLHEIGEEQEQAAATLGASRWQTFWRITLPAIRWGLTYGVVLTVARALGEFGAVIMVSAGISGESQTLTLLVHARYIDDHNTFGAYAAATVLMGLALLTLFLMTMLNRKREST